MAGNFGFVDDKVKEADFFLDRLRNSGTNFEEARFFFSAFVSAARSITFSLQFVLSDSEGFTEWYTKKQADMRSDPLARFFLEVRNEVQKRGSNPLASFSGLNKQSVQYYFIYWYGDSPDGVPDLDVVTACHQYIVSLVQLIYECYSTFGNIIDPEQYYTMQNLERLGLTIDDLLERELGIPRGWTKDVTPEDTLRFIREQETKPEIDHIFIKYLGHDRFGNVSN